MQTNVPIIEEKPSLSTPLKTLLDSMGGRIEFPPTFFDRYGRLARHIGYSYTDLMKIIKYLLEKTNIEDEETCEYIDNELDKIEEDLCNAFYDS